MLEAHSQPLGHAAGLENTQLHLDPGGNRQGEISNLQAKVGNDFALKEMLKQNGLAWCMHEIHHPQVAQGRMLLTARVLGTRSGWPVP